MATIDVLNSLVAPIVASLDADLYDLEFNGGVVKVTVDRPGGIDLESIAEVTRQISRQIDLDDPIPGSFTLEVTSPGLERNLRLPRHWVGAVGERVRVKMVPGFDGERRVDGTVVAVTDDSATISMDGAEYRCSFDDISRARTVFEWAPTPKPGSPAARAAASTASAGVSAAATSSASAGTTNESEVS